jgi:hypothetical protein
MIIRRGDYHELVRLLNEGLSPNTRLNGVHEDLRPLSARIFEQSNLLICAAEARIKAKGHEERALFQQILSLLFQRGASVPEAINILENQKNLLLNTLRQSYPTFVRNRIDETYWQVLQVLFQPDFSSRFSFDLKSLDFLSGYNVRNFDFTKVTLNKMPVTMDDLISRHCLDPHLAILPKGYSQIAQQSDRPYSDYGRKW